MSLLRIGAALIADTVLTVATMGAYAAIKTVDNDFLVKKELDKQREIEAIKEVIDAARKRNS